MTNRPLLPFRSLIKVYSRLSSRIRILYDKRAVLLDEDPASNEESHKRYLIISDLHIGFEERYKHSGVRLSSSIDSLVEEVVSLVETYEVTNLVINGDVKSSITRITSLEWENVPRFFNRLPQNCKVTVITGNHDVGIKELVPENVEIVDSDGALLTDTLLIHGHTRPLPKFWSPTSRIIMGHVHPIFQSKGSLITGQPVWILIKANKANVFFQSPQSISENSENDEIELVVMPSFNMDLVVAGYASETAKEERKNAPILRQIGNVREAMVLTLQGDLIGDSSMLSRVL